MSFASYFVSNILVKRGKPRTALHHYDYLNVVLERAMLRAVLWLGGLLWAPGLEMRAADGDAAPSTLSCSPTLCSKTNPRSQNWYLKDAFPAPFWRCFRWTFQSLFLFWDEETCPPQQSLTVFAFLLIECPLAIRSQTTVTLSLLHMTYFLNISAVFK